MAKYNFENISFLIVDDSPHMVTIIKGILKGFGSKSIFEAEDGTAAIQRMKMNPIDIVICDWVMEPLDGFDFTKLIRTAPDSPNPYVPIVMLTGYTEQYRVTGSRDIGVTEFLVKPVTGKALLSRLISIIDEPRAFVKVPTYSGPDRRRHKNSAYTGIERREQQTSVGKVV